MAKTQTATSSVSIPKEWQDRFNNIYGQAESAAAEPFHKWGDTASDFVAPVNQQQNTGISGVNAAAGSYQPYMDSATSAAQAGGQNAELGQLDIQKYMSPYIQNVADTTAAQMNQQFQQAQAGQMGNAIKSGAFGGDRAGLAAAALQNQQAMATGSTMANIYNQGYGQAVNTAQQQQGADLSARQADLARQFQLSGQIANLGSQQQQLGLQGAEAQIQAGTLQQQTEQAGKDALIQQFMQEKGYPFQVAQYLANIGGNLGSLYGSETTQTTPRSFWGNRGGAVPEKAGGGGVAGPYGSTAGSTPESGMPSYVPEAYLQPLQLLQADPNVSADQQATLAQRAQAAASFGDSLSSLKDNFGSGTDSSVFDLFGSLGLGRAAGGVVDSTKTFQSPSAPNGDGGYMQSIMDAQTASKLTTPATPIGGGAGGSAGGGGGGLGGLLSGVGSAASGIAAVLPLLGLSDPRAKEDAERIGYTDNGMPIHKFKYKDDPSGQTHVGFMADEIAREHPDAVHKRPDGYLGVDYSKAGKFASGGVAGYMGDVIESSNSRHDMPNQQSSSDKSGGLGAIFGDLSGLQSVISPHASGGRTGYAEGGGPSFEASGRSNPGTLVDQAIVAKLMNSGAAPAITGSADFQPGGSWAGANVDLGTKPKLEGPSFEGLGRGSPSISSSSPLAVDRSPIPPARPQDMTGLGSADISSVLEKTASTTGNGASPAAPAISDPNYGLAGSSAKPSPKPTSGKITGDYIVDGLVSRGMPEHVAKGYAINSWDESGFNPGAIGDNGNAVGLWQFNGARRDSLMDFANQNGKSWQDPEVQFDYVVWENANGEKGAYNKVLATDNPQDAARAVVNYWERPAEEHRSSRDAAYANWDGSSYPGTGSNTTTMSTSGGPGPHNGSPTDWRQPDTSGGARGALDRIVHNPDGSVNKDFLLSILSGVGTMASSPSVNFLTSVLQGAGAAANTYAGQEARRTDIEGKQYENRKAAYDAWMQATSTGAVPENMPFQEWLKYNPQYAPTTSGMDIGTARTADPSGNTYTIDELQTKTITYPDGSVVPAINDRDYVNKWNAANAARIAYAPAWKTAAETAANAISGLPSGQTRDVSGKLILQPGLTSTSGQVANQESNNVRSGEFRNEGNTYLSSVPQQKQLVSDLQEIYTNLQAGSGANLFSNIDAIANYVDPTGQAGWRDMVTKGDASERDKALKDAAMLIQERLGTMPMGAPAASMELASAMTPNPNMEPGALFSLTARTSAAQKYNEEYYKGYDPAVWNNDVNAYTNAFVYGDEAKGIKPHNFEDYVKQAEIDTPWFKGMPLPAKEKLIVGKSYPVPGHGNMVWNGKEFN